MPAIERGVMRIPVKMEERPKSMTAFTCSPKTVKLRPETVWFSETNYSHVVVVEASGVGLTQLECKLQLVNDMLEGRQRASAKASTIFCGMILFLLLALSRTSCFRRREGMNEEEIVNLFCTKKSLASGARKGKRGTKAGRRKVSRRKEKGLRKEDGRAAGEVEENVNKGGSCCGGDENETKEQDVAAIEDSSAIKGEENQQKYHEQKQQQQLADETASSKKSCCCSLLSSSCSSSKAPQLPKPIRPPEATLSRKNHGDSPSLLSSLREDTVLRYSCGCSCCAACICSSKPMRPDDEGVAIPVTDICDRLEGVMEGFVWGGGNSTGVCDCKNE